MQTKNCHKKKIFFYTDQNTSNTFLLYRISVMDRNISLHLIQHGFEAGGHSVYRSAALGHRRFTKSGSASEQNKEGWYAIGHNQLLLV